MNIERKKNCSLKAKLNWYKYIHCITSITHILNTQYNGAELGRFLKKFYYGEYFVIEVYNLGMNILYFMYYAILCACVTMNMLFLSYRFLHLGIQFLNRLIGAR
jgi:hypothetical protein